MTALRRLLSVVIQAAVVGFKCLTASYSCIQSFLALTRLLIRSLQSASTWRSPRPPPQARGGSWPPAYLCFLRDIRRITLDSRSSYPSRLRGAPRRRRGLSNGLHLAP